MVDHDGLDSAGVLARAGEVLLARRAAEVEDLRLVSRWAMLHASDPRRDPGGARGDYLVPVGGEGSPWVRELCLSELAIIRCTHVLSLRSVMGDVLDLQHRLPRVWALVEALAAEAWVARRVASLSRKVAFEHMGVIDAAVATAIVGESPSRVLEIAQAKVVEADPAGHAARLEAERRRRYVSLSRTDEHGLRHVIARVQAGDAVYVDAMVDRVADILAARWAADHPPANEQPGQPDRLSQQVRVKAPSKDEFRSDAFGWLARPAEVMALLLEHAQTNPTTQTTADRPAVLDVLGGPAREGRGTPGFSPVPDWEAGAGSQWEPGWIPSREPRATDSPEDPADALALCGLPALPDLRDLPHRPEGEPEPEDAAPPPPDPQDPADGSGGCGLVESRTTAFPADLLGVLAGIDPARLRPSAVLYVHLTDQGLAHPETGVARLEDIGPLLASQLTDLLAHTQVTLKPVIDLNDEISVLAYEHQAPIKERIWLRNLGDAFPYATSTGRRVDYDHPDPYRRHGPPGQTGTHNSQPLGRRHHRHKTHAGYTTRQVGPATYLWRTPHGHHLLKGPTGTHPISPDQGTRLLEASPAELRLMHLLRTHSHATVA